MSAYGPVLPDIWWRGLPGLGLTVIGIVLAAVISGDLASGWVTIEITIDDPFWSTIIWTAFLVVGLVFAIPMVQGQPSVARLLGRTAFGAALLGMGSASFVLLLFQDITSYDAGFWNAVGGFFLIAFLAMQLFATLGLVWVAILATGNGLHGRLTKAER